MPLRRALFTSSLLTTICLLNGNNNIDLGAGNARFDSSIFSLVKSSSCRRRRSWFLLLSAVIIVGLSKGLVGLIVSTNGSTGFTI